VVPIISVGNPLLATAFSLTNIVSSFSKVFYHTKYADVVLLGVKVYKDSLRFVAHFLELSLHLIFIFKFMIFRRDVNVAVIGIFSFNL